MSNENTTPPKGRNANQIFRDMFIRKTGGAPGGQKAAPQPVTPEPEIPEAAGPDPDSALGYMVRNLENIGFIPAESGRDSFTYAIERVRRQPVVGLMPSDVTIQMFAGDKPIRARVFFGTTDRARAKHQLLMAVAYAELNRVSGPYIQVMIDRNLPRWIPRGDGRRERADAYDGIDPYSLDAEGQNGIFDLPRFTDAVSFQIDEAGGIEGRWSL
jgi:hypothetical protein